jgi:phage shock protein A
LLEEAKEATKVLDQRLMELGGQLNTANQRCQELEAQNEALKRQIDRATGDIDRDTGKAIMRIEYRGRGLFWGN